ncbi:2Fe-2S iron-sulfur cluster-binding protein [Anaeromyxobacter paludicola]|uniref:Uncharacterized protein n=1 Tax=Anaeromyxobacter paludicola TaxID=2918171 RepID=A0ABN6N2H6_9BACT|nr:2Fe-2S iron-sulfur cluster-binding protein [Anaeromyxobacter paludicola]BDG07141.1 hypothetical protein AMPC_02540 [Anaeromyxobacter paludicola]
MPRLPEPRFVPDCAILVDGVEVPARAGESVAVALVAAGRPLVSRSYKYHRPRGPFCLAGSCGSCLARVDGQPSLRTCRVACRDGLRVETQNAFPSARHDLLAVVDRATPHGLDHHHLLTSPVALNRVVVEVSRRLAGLGRLPDRAPGPFPAATLETFDALVVGAGPAGLGAAEALAAAGRRVLVAEQAPRAGGRLRAGLPLRGEPPLAWAAEVEGAVGRAGGELALATAALGLWRDGGSPIAALAAEAPPRLRLVRASVLVLATGGTAVPPVFPGNDVPGIFAGRALAVARAEHGLLPGARCLVLGEGEEAAAVAARLAGGGLEVVARPGPALLARGRARVRAVELAGERLRCDAVAWVTPPAPAAELARELGARLELLPALSAFAVAVDAEGRTGVPGLFAAGEVTGPLDGAAAAAAGRRAGEAALRG